MPPSALICRGISRTFGKFNALDNVDLQVDTGETFGLLGPNGAGKSTLINILSGVLRHDAGTIEYFGEELREPSHEFKLSLGVIPQEITLYETLTARENLEFFGKIYGLRGGALKSSIDEVLELVGLLDRQNDRISTYSGGMKRRINIASSILHSPKFIMMDEPTVGIDPQSRNLIFEVIEKFHADGTTIIYTSHYMEEVERLCTRIAVLDHGRIIAGGTRSELVALMGGVDAIEIEFDGDPDTSGLVDKFEGMDPELVDDRLILKTENGSAKLGEIIGRLSNIGVAVKRIQVREPNLENVFLHLTGKGLRD